MRHASLTGAMLAVPLVRSKRRGHRKLCDAGRHFTKSLDRLVRLIISCFPPNGGKATAEFLRLLVDVAKKLFGLTWPHVMMGMPNEPLRSWAKWATKQGTDASVT